MTSALRVLGDFCHECLKDEAEGDKSRVRVEI